MSSRSLDPKKEYTGIGGCRPRGACLTFYFFSIIKK